MIPSAVGLVIVIIIVAVSPELRRGGTAIAEDESAGEPADGPVLQTDADGTGV